MEDRKIERKKLRAREKVREREKLERRNEGELKGKGLAVLFLLFFRLTHGMSLSLSHCLYCHSFSIAVSHFFLSIFKSFSSASFSVDVPLTDCAALRHATDAVTL